ncbi:MAG: TlyA family RNA methyltransferase [Clostridia bacterium]|nr:TlyA family RNA methyltransferase [Clostridia bacterium]
MRLDRYLADQGFYKSRERAARAIESGCVKVNDRVILKTSFQVEEDIKIDCSPDPVPYVSRGGLKLLGALERFKLSPDSLCCLDIGASTGGFTHVLLEKGASEVTCVDVGHGQLDPILRADPRVRVYEGTDARTFRPEASYDFICMDVSFISVTQMLETVCALIKPTSNIVILIKPQFELSRSALNKNGIVKNKEMGLRRVQEIISFFCEQGNLKLGGFMESPIQGGDGNIEYCAWFLPLV